MKNILTDKIQSARSWVLQQPRVQDFRQKHPKFTSFVAGRFSTSYFVGLPLTLILLAAGVNIVLLSELTESVLDSEWVVVVDKQFTSALFNMRMEWLSTVMLAITRLADQIGVFIIGGVVTLVWLFRKDWIAILAFWVALGGVGLSVRLSKSFISRARPADVAYYVVEHFSFPSGHATTAVVLFGLLAYFLYRHLRERWQRLLVVWLSVIVVLSIGFSRIYLGVHYLSDVLAGFLLGALWLLVGVSMVEVRLYRERRYNNLQNK